MCGDQELAGAAVGTGATLARGYVRHPGAVPHKDTFNPQRWPLKAHATLASWLRSNRPPAAAHSAKNATHPELREHDGLGQPPPAARSTGQQHLALGKVPRRARRQHRPHLRGAQSRRMQLCPACRAGQAYLLLNHKRVVAIKARGRLERAGAYQTSGQLAANSHALQAQVPAPK